MRLIDLDELKAFCSSDLQSEAIPMLNNLIAATKLPEFNFTWPTISGPISPDSFLSSLRWYRFRYSGLALPHFFF